MEQKELLLGMLGMLELIFGQKNEGGGKSGFERYMGKNIFIRTVTHHYTGHVTDVDSMSLTMDQAAWIPDDGRLNESLKDPDKFGEVEPYLNPITINLYSILDVTEISKLIQEVR